MERISLYCGSVDSEGVGGIFGLDSEDEDILARTVPFSELWQQFLEGQVNSASPIIALQWLAQHRSRLRVKWSAKA